MEDQLCYFVIPSKVQERIKEFYLASGCTLQDLAEHRLF